MATTASQYANVPNARSSAPVAAPAAVLPPGVGRDGAHRALLEAGVVAFAERGYHGVSVRDLTGTVGIKAASFYAHFTSKEALLAELMLAGHEAHQIAVRGAILGAGADPVEQLRAAVQANVEFQATWPLVTIVCNSELHALSRDNRDRVVSVRHNSGTLVVAIIERGNASGAFRCDDVWLALSAIGAMGIRIGWWFRPPSLRGDGSPLSEYPREAATWMEGDAYSVESIVEAYTTFALRLVGADA